MRIKQWMAVVFLATAISPMTAIAATEGAEKSPRILGGGYEPIADTPWQVLIESSSGGETYICGGVVVSENYILTAAHCMDKDPDDNNGAFTPYLPSEVIIFAGVEDRNNLSGNGITASNVTIHPNYKDFNLTYDIALVRLSSSLPNNAKPVVILPPSQQSVLESEFATPTLDNLFVSGWGRTSNSVPGDPNSGQSSRYLKSTILTGEPDQFCGRIGSVDSGNYLCATSSENTGACNGDSGGGLIWRDPSHSADSDMGYRVVGVVSWGSVTCGVPNDEDVFAQVSSYYSWIDSTMGGYTPPNSVFTADIFDTSDAYNPVPDNVVSGSGGGGGYISLFALLFLGFNIVSRRRFLS
ncbi:serine protease [Enterovibrio sp. Hal110]